MALINPGLGINSGVTHGNATRCGAASAVYLLKLLGKINDFLEKQNPDSFQDLAMAQTHTTGSAEALGSTPRKIAEYVLAECPANVNLVITRASEAHLSTKEKGEARVRRTTKPWLATIRNQSKSYPVGSGIYGPGDAILRHCVPARVSQSGHFVVKTFFSGQSQIMDPDNGAVTTVSFEDYLNAVGNQQRMTLLDLVFSSY